MGQNFFKTIAMLLGSIRLSILYTVLAMFVTHIALAQTCRDFFEDHKPSSSGKIVVEGASKQDLAEQLKRHELSILRARKNNNKELKEERKLKRPKTTYIDEGQFPTESKDKLLGFNFALRNTTDWAKIDTEYDSRTVHLPELKLDPSDLQRSNFTQNLSINGNSYQLSNIAQTVFNRSINNWDKKIDSITYAVPLNKTFFLPLDARYWQIKGHLDQVSMYTSKLVTDNYLKRKPYLSEQDLFNLRSSDLMFTEGSEYWVLTDRQDGKNIFDLNKNQFEESLASVIRLARYNNRGKSLDISNFGHQLPFMTRLNSHQNYSVRQFLNNLIDKGISVAEISRFNRFKKTDPAVLEYLIYNIFTNKNRTNPVDVFVIEVDAITKKLFAKYNFKELMKIKSEKDSEEYLMYLDVNSQAFKKTISELESKIKPIAFSQEKGIIESTPTKKFYQNFDEYALGSLHNKRLEIHEKLLELRKLASANKALLFSTEYKKLIEKIYSHIPEQGNILLSEGRLSEAIAGHMRLLTPDLNIIVLPRNDFHKHKDSADGVILLDSISEQSEAQVSKLLIDVRAALKHNKKLIFIERTIDPDFLQKETPSLRDVIENTVLDFKKNGYGLSEAEKVNIIGFVKDNYSKMMVDSLKTSDIKKLLIESGFFFDNFTGDGGGRTGWGLTGQVIVTQSTSD